MIFTPIKGCLSPALFAYRYLGLELYPWQAETVEACAREHAAVALVAANGSGKTAAVNATLLLWWLYAYPRGRAAVTSGSWEQLESQLWPALMSYAHVFTPLLGWQFNAHEVRTPAGGFVRAFSTLQPNRAEGHHEKPGANSPMLILVDEAKGIDEGIFDALHRCTPTGSVDLILTDPPYGTTDCPWDVCPPWKPLFAELWRVLKPNGALLVFAQNPLAAELICMNRRSFRYEWIWEKNRAQGFLNATRAPLRAHELILVFYRRLPTYNAIPIENQSGKPYKRIKNNYVPLYDFYDRGTCSPHDGSRRPRDVIRFDTTAAAALSLNLHPTQKPLPLLRMLIRQYTHPGQLILDPFAGSASTLRAAQHENRRAIGIEKDPSYHTAATHWLASPLDRDTYRPRSATDPTQLSLAL